jgi:hypothetical protein
MAGYMRSRDVDDLIRFIANNPDQVKKWRSQFKPRYYVVVAESPAELLRIARNVDKLKTPKPRDGYDLVLLREARRLQKIALRSHKKCSDDTAIKRVAMQAASDSKLQAAIVARLRYRLEKEQKTLKRFDDEFQELISKISRLK